MTDDERRRDLLSRLHGFGSQRNPRNIPICKEAAGEIERLAALAQSDAKPVAWLPDADMRAELDRSELVARALLKEIMKQIDCIEAEGNIEWHKRIKLNGELYLPDLAVAVLAVLYTAPPRPDYELSAIAAAIGSSRFMDPPDGGDVSLAEQVCRMREALEKAEARPDASAEPRVTLDEIEAAMDRVLERHGFHITPGPKDIATGWPLPDRAADRGGK